MFLNHSQGTALGKMTVRDYMTFEGSPVVIVNKFLPDRRLQVAWKSIHRAWIEVGFTASKACLDVVDFV